MRKCNAESQKTSVKVPVLQKTTVFCPSRNYSTLWLYIPSINVNLSMEERAVQRAEQSGGRTTCSRPPREEQGSWEWSTSTASPHPDSVRLAAMSMREARSGLWRNGPFLTQ